MNVSRNGYYTSEYIDHRIHGTPLSPLSGQFSVGEPLPKEKNLRFDLPSLISSSTSRTNPDDLPEDITPAQLNYLHKGQAPTLQRPRPSVSYDNYYRKSQKPKSRPVDDDLFGDQASSTNTEEILFHEPKARSIEDHNEYTGYYIDQKKRYDRAEFVKPKIYTHKTFKDVFKADVVDERYNPIDLVFEDPQEIQELEQKKKFTRAMKTVQKRMGYDDYDSYDYYTQQKLDEERRLIEQEKEKKRLEKERIKQEKQAKKSGKKGLKLSLLKKLTPPPEEEKEVFVENPDGDSDVEIGEESPEKKKKNISKNLKMKWKLAKKQLGDNYFDNYAKNVGEKPLGDHPPVEEEAPQVEYVEEEQVVPTRHGVGPNENFNPFWNYLLSYLVYELPQAHSQAAVESPAGKIVEIVEHEVAREEKPAKKRKTKAKLSKEKSGPKMKISLPYKEVLKNWNQPADMVFSGQRGQKLRELVPMDHTNESFDVVSDMSSDYPEEHLIYYDDEDSLDDELIYDPETGTLVPVSRAQSAGAFSAIHSGTPLKIILNVNQLIKSIKIMKIIFAPIDVISEIFPNAQTLVILVELVIFMWMLYELSLLIDAICMAVKAVCAPMIAIGKFMNRIV